MEKSVKKHLSLSSVILFLFGLNIVLLLVVFDVPFGADKDNFSLKLDKINVASLNLADFPELQEVKNHISSFNELSDYFEEISNNKGAEYAFSLLRLSQLPPTTCPKR